LKKIIILSLFFLALNVAAYCAQANRIQLTDGSVINGEIISYLNGIYVINTAAFGEIKIEAAKISKIESEDAPAVNTPVNTDIQTNIPNKSMVDSYRQKLMANPENAAVITGLATDPAIQDLAKDPQIMEAAKAGDIQGLMKNPKFINIVNNPKMQEAIKKLKQ